MKSISCIRSIFIAFKYDESKAIISIEINFHLNFHDRTKRREIRSDFTFTDFSQESLRIYANEKEYLQEANK